MKQILTIGSILSCTIMNTFAYDAYCELDNNIEIDISVYNKVMTIDNKYKAHYDGKTFTGWYIYENKRYKYIVGKFKYGKFPIEVTNKYQNVIIDGTCYFNN
jgi:hypothetical protein